MNMYPAAPNRSIVGNNTVNVRNYGAIGNGSANDTAAINAAIKACSDLGGGTIQVPFGFYCIDVITQIDMKSKCRLQVHPLARMLAMKTGEERYQMINLRGCTDFEITGGIWYGDRDVHDYAGEGTEEWGHCFAVYGAKRGNIVGVHVSNFPGDGLSVGRNDTVRSDDIYIANSVFTRNRRQGISIVTGDNIFVYDCECSFTGDERPGEANGTEPMCGIDVEPEAAAGSIKNIQIIGCRLIGNKRYGLLFERRSDDNGGADIFDSIVTDNEIAYNYSNGCELKGPTRTQFARNLVHDNSASGIVLNGDKQSFLDLNQFGRNYYRNGVKNQNPPFWLVGTNSKTERDILKKNSTTATFGSNYFY